MNQVERVMDHPDTVLQNQQCNSHRQHARNANRTGAVDIDTLNKYCCLECVSSVTESSLGCFDEFPPQTLNPESVERKIVRNAV